MLESLPTVKIDIKGTAALKAGGVASKALPQTDQYETRNGAG
ncbi:MAG: hypothetical protein ACJATP_002568, partial [Candidatus Azotimanducaceae bacterium]